MWVWPKARGVRPSREAMAAAVPAASPPTAQVAITRVEPMASLEALMFRPAIIRLEILAEQ